MKHKFGLLIALVVVSTFLVGCGGSGKHHLLRRKPLKRRLL
jgi:hypothetical protein